MAARANCETESPWKRKNQPPAVEGEVGGGRRIDDFGFWILDLEIKKFLNGGDDTAGVVRGF